MVYSVLSSVLYVLYTKQRNVHRGDIQETCNKLQAYDKRTDYHLSQLVFPTAQNGKNTTARKEPTQTLQERCSFLL